MSNKKQETIEDIVAEMRNDGHAGDSSCLEWVGEKMRTYADRIEAAAKREREATSEKSSRVGNAAKMRDALKETKSVIEKCMNILRYIPEGNEYDEILDEVANNLWDLQKIHVKPAISAPPRNCDRLECATTKAAQDVWHREDGGKTPYYEWLLAAATKGEKK